LDFLVCLLCCSVHTHFDHWRSVLGFRSFKDTDNVVCVASKQDGAITVPSKGQGLSIGRLGVKFWDVLVQLGNEGLALEVPDLDSCFSCSTEPILGGTEDQLADGISTFKRVQMFSFIEIPQTNRAISSSRSTEGAIRRDSHTVHIGRVTNKVSAKFAILKIPHLDHLVPTTRYNGRVLGVGRESNTTDPLRVTLIFDGVLALTKCIPKLDGLITRARDNLSVVSREGNAENVFGVSNKTSCSGTKIQIPKAKCTIPRTRKSELTIRGEGKVLDEVRVASKCLAWYSIVLVRLSR